MISTLWAVALLGTIPQVEPLECTVDAIEVNHVVSDEGKPLFTQLIFYAQDEEGRTRIVEWRFARTCKGDSTEKAGLPLAAGGGVYNSILLSGPYLVKVRCRTVFETTANYDHEVTDRETYPVSKRRGLYGHAP